MARVPEKRVLDIEAYAVFHYINAEIQEEDEVESDEEIVLL